ncbi:PREDICTED: cardiotrophin-1 [Dipodomys ordii]|uniref:Cardiotrophin-1 n=1 Tax=Dipodomys ordii TaxID=10020 RepID=A0A1S3EQH7_DIPOR|nr:PREDICTED: cardiotrophin-1 [Dipodomys ordii]
MSQREGSLEEPKAESSISLLPHLEAKIRQTHSLARLLTKYAEQLLQEYMPRLEEAARQARALGAAVETVLAALGASAHGSQGSPTEAATAAAPAPAPGGFSAKVLGLHVCGLYGEWVSRTEGDLGQLVSGAPA